MTVGPGWHGQHSVGEKDTVDGVLYTGRACANCGTVLMVADDARPAPEYRGPWPLCWMCHSQGYVSIEATS